MRASPRKIVIATVVVCALLLSVMTGMAYQRYVEVQNEARSALQTALSTGHEQVSAFAEQQAAVEQALANAEKIASDSAGKTLDDVARKALAAEIIRVRSVQAAQEKQSQKFAGDLAIAQRRSTDSSLWPPDELAVAKSLIDRSSSDALVRLVESLGTQIKAVQVAQAAWQAEQDRIAAAAAAEAQAAAEKAAADEAARLAAPRRISPVSTISDGGGSTAPSAPAPPPTPVAPVVGFDIEAYVLALAPNSYISWVPSLCAGYYVCGRTWVGGASTNLAKIELDSSLKDIYPNRVGLSVLVHESAHARQWNYYGSIAAMKSGSLALTGGLSPTDDGTASVEYMADCATIGKLGYSTGTYTSSCTSEQLAAIANIW